MSTSLDESQLAMERLISAYLTMSNAKVAFERAAEQYQQAQDSFAECLDAEIVHYSLDRSVETITDREVEL